MSNDTAFSVEAPPARGLAARFKGLLLSQRRNLENLSALVFFNFAAAGLFFVTQVKIANVIGREQFGLLAYGIALGMYGQTIVRYGMDRTLVRDLIHYPDRFSELVVASLILRGILLALVAATLLAWKLIWQPADLSWPVIAVIMAYSLKSLDLQPVYDAWHRMARHAVYNAIQRGLYFLLIWGIVLTGSHRLTLAWIGLGLLATEIMYLILQQWWAQGQMCLPRSSPSYSPVIRKLIADNVWIWLASIIALSFGALNQIILKHYCGAAELGEYAASWQITAAVVLLLTQVGRIGKPAMAWATRPGIDSGLSGQFLLRYSCVMVLIAAGICAPLIICPELVLRTVFKAEYISSAGILRTLSVYMVVYSLGVAGAQYVISARMQTMYFLSVAMGGILSIFLCMVLIPRMKAQGAATALLVAYTASTGLYWIAALRHLRRRVPT